MAEYTSSDKADELRGVQEPEYVRLCHPSLGLKIYTCLKQPGSVSQTGAGNPDFISPHRVRDLCPGAQHHLLGVRATRHCGPHPLSLGYSTGSERDFSTAGVLGATHSSQGWNVNSSSTRRWASQQTAAFHLRLQKPKAHGRKGALNLANTKWLAGVGQCLELLCSSASSAPPPLTISSQHLVPCGRDSSPTSHHFRDPSHPRASSSPTQSSTTHLLPLNSIPLPYLGLCGAPIQTPEPSPPAPSQTFKLLLPLKKHPSAL